MNIKTKIVLIFAVSFAIVAVFGLTVGLDFWEARKDFDLLKVSDSIRSQVLELRRHEKNLFLFGDHDEITKMEEIFLKTESLIREGRRNVHREQMFSELQQSLEDYKRAFYEVTSAGQAFREALNSLQKENPSWESLGRIVASTFLSTPLPVLEALKNVFHLPEKSPAISLLRDIDIRQQTLRRSGEDIIHLSSELDREVRDRVQRMILMSETGIFIVFPLAFIIGFVFILVVIQGILRRLSELMNTISHADEGYFSPMPFPSGHDEVGTLIRTYNNMAEALRVRDQQLKKKEAELLHSKKLASIGTLASGVAHELNNPLNNIHLSAQMLHKQMGPTCPPIVHDVVEDILSQSIRVKKTVGDLLEFARYKDPHFDRIDVVEIVERSIRDVRRMGDTTGIHFTVQAPPRLEISADPLRIERMFLNLFSNAIDAMGPKGELTVELSPTGDASVKIVVRDTGSGIPADLLEKIFDPFVTTKDKGTGLGLSIIYNIVRNHHGRIDVDSREGVGTTFTIHLPREQ